MKCSNNDHLSCIIVAVGLIALASAPAVVAGKTFLDHQSLEIGVPNMWDGVRLTAADGRDCTAASADLCSYRMVGDGAVKVINFIKVHNGVAGDRFDLTVWRDNSGLAAGDLAMARIALVYADGARQTERAVFPTADGGWVEEWVSLIADEPYRRVVVSLVLRSAVGQLRLDEASLLLNSATEFLENGSFEIEVPLGWRGSGLTVEDGIDCSTASVGACSYRVVGPGPVGIKNLYIVKRHRGGPGDDDWREFGFAWRSEAADGWLTYFGFIKHNDGQLGGSGGNLTNGTHDWLGGTPTGGVIRKSYWGLGLSLRMRDSGTVWWDNVSLAVGPKP